MSRPIDILLTTYSQQTEHKSRYYFKIRPTHYSVHIGLVHIIVLQRTSLSSAAATDACEELDDAFIFVFISPTALRAKAVATLPECVWSGRPLLTIRSHEVINWETLNLRKWTMQEWSAVAKPVYKINK